MARRLTPQLFIEKATKIHGNKYDYSKINYVHSSKKIPIICKINNHGEFQQSPQKHLNGQGCPKCRYIKMAEKQRTPLNIFIKKARSIHGDKYVYDEIKYKNNHTKIIIKCKIHGNFEMTPGNHIHKTKPQGCPECGGKKRWSKEMFITAAEIKHERKYSYYKVNFYGISKPVIIICPKHGDFFQKPIKHIAGQGCPICAGTKRKTKEQFIEQAKRIHGNKYNYGKVVYLNNHKKVIIECPLHGDFEMTPANHTHIKNPQGCIKCSGKKVFNTDDFIEHASLIHDGLYKYSEVNYINSLTPVKIECPYCGFFMQKPYVHLHGSGCPKCRSSKGEYEIEKYLKNNNISYQNQYSFPDCRYKNLLPFDFIIYINNKPALIEYNGEQHYKNISFSSGGDNSNLLEIKKRDKIKREYCKSKKIPLLVVHYEEFERIDEKLNEFINDLRRIG